MLSIFFFKKNKQNYFLMLRVNLALMLLLLFLLIF